MLFADAPVLGACVRDSARWPIGRSISLTDWLPLLMIRRLFDAVASFADTILARYGVALMACR